VVVRVRVIVRVKVIVRVEVIPYTSDSPASKFNKCRSIGEGAFAIGVERLPELRKLSESKIYHIRWVSQVKVEVMAYYRWGCIPYQSWVVARVMEIVRVKVIVRVEVIPYTLGSPESKLK